MKFSFVGSWRSFVKISRPDESSIKKRKIEKKTWYFNFRKNHSFESGKRFNWGFWKTHREGFSWTSYNIRSCDNGCCDRWICFILCDFKGTRSEKSRCCRAWARSFFSFIVCYGMMLYFSRDISTGWRMWETAMCHLDKLRSLHFC